MNFDPKSLNAELCGYMSMRNYQGDGIDVPKQTTSLSRDEGYAILVSPIVDFELLLK